MVYNIYVDGSYKNYGKQLGAFYSGAVAIAKEGNQKPETFLTKVSQDELISMRNVAGELVAVMMAFEHCLNVLKLTQEDTVRIIYDYHGIENWTLKKGDPNYWKCKNPITRAYRDYVNTIVRPRFKVEFRHISAHTGHAGNELVDALARGAIEKHVREKLVEVGKINE